MRAFVFAFSIFTAFGFACKDAIGFPVDSGPAKPKVGRPSSKAGAGSADGFRQQLEQAGRRAAEAAESLKKAEADAKVKRDALADAGERERRAAQIGRGIELPGVGGRR